METTTERLEIYYKAKEDSVYFIEHFIELEEVGGNILFKLYDPQKDFLRTIVNDHHVITLKSRQIGISTIVQAFIVWALIFNKNVVVGVVSRDGPESTDFCRKVMAMIRNLPDWIRPKFVKEAEQTFILDNGCKFHASQVNAKKPENLFRGKACTIVVVDEAAFIDYIDEAFSGFGPTLVKAQSAAEAKGVPYGTIVISTPNKTVGIGKWYYERWVEAETNPNSIYKAKKIHWKQVKEFREDPTWYPRQCAILHNDRAKIQQELEMKFLASINSFFPGEIIEKLNDVDTPPIAKLTFESHDLQIWKQPNKDSYYMICVDVASASGTDYSAIEIIDYVTFEQVAEYVGKLRVDDFCKVVESVCKIFPRNLTIVEENSYGNQVIEFLTRSSIDHNLYQHKIKNTAKNKRPTYKYGLSTNAQTRPLIFDSLYTYVSENTNLIKSRKLALELIGLEENTGGRINRVEASRGMNDDMAISLGFGAYVRMYDPPMSISSVTSEAVVDDMMGVLDMGFSEGSYSSDINDMKYREKMTQHDVSNKILKHIKENLHEVSKDSPMVDVTKILGFNINDSDDIVH
jgi:hypothetical protein